MTSGSATSPLRIGSATIRDLTAFQAELAERLDDLRAQARAVEWIECSPALRRAAGSLGLESALSPSGQ
jgi:hypothetical protein